ncbi:MAG: hypothetical protein ACP5SH_00515 [Syntrophobacteraceae bacterium]
MKIKYCKKYEKYVSGQHCEFFNDGRFCEFYNETSWPSIKELLRDLDRPKWETNAIIKPFKCSLMSRENTHQRDRTRRLGKRTGLSSQPQSRPSKSSSTQAGEKSEISPLA